MSTGFADQRSAQPINLQAVIALRTWLGVSTHEGLDAPQLDPVLHWCLLPNAVPPDEVGNDGHPKLPKAIAAHGLPRRMWASSQVRYCQAIMLPTVLERHSVCTAVQLKEGRSGRLLFATWEHRISSDGVLARVEQQQVVYREAYDASRAAAPAAVTALPSELQGAALMATRTLTPTAVDLFRFSALTHNGHRIHYDQPYCQHQEGYPDLVVHGPWLAMQLLHTARLQRSSLAISEFSFRAVQPAFVNEPIRFDVLEHGGDRLALIAFNASEQPLMFAEIHQ
jgi:3-methylfumaryl-CoA hydratase